MKKDRKYLDFYESCMKTGQLPGCGLCETFTDYIEDEEGWIDDEPDEIFELFTPTIDDIDRLYDEGLCYLYWASGLSERYTKKRYHEFTPLRQTIVLFMAAINGEL